MACVQVGVESLTPLFKLHYVKRVAANTIMACVCIFVGTSCPLTFFVIWLYSVTRVTANASFQGTGTS